jgi:hypothetical protein
MTPTSFDIVSVFNRRDQHLQELQLQSLLKFVEDESVSSVVLIWNDETDKPQSVAGYKVISASELGVGINYIRQDGWTTQQVLKLLAAFVTSSEYFLVLDAENHFLSSCSTRDFFSDDGRILSDRVDLKNNQSFRYANSFFDLSIPSLREQDYSLPLNITPFMMCKNTVVDMVDLIQKRQGMKLIEVFFRHRNKLNEFMAYLAFQRFKGGRFTDIYVDRKSKFSHTIWGGLVFQTLEFVELVRSLHRGDYKMLGLHWIACSLMTQDQKNLLIDFWLSVGLVHSFPEGVKIIDSVKENLTKHDRFFLQKFLLNS